MSELPKIEVEYFEDGSADLLMNEPPSSCTVGNGDHAKEIAHRCNAYPELVEVLHFLEIFTSHDFGTREMPASIIVDKIRYALSKAEGKTK